MRLHSACCCSPGRGESTTPTGAIGDGMSDDDDEEEFDQLISGTPSSTKAVKKEKGSRKRDALEGGADSDSSASGPSSTSASAKKAKMGRPQLKTKTEEPSSTHSEGEGRESPMHTPTMKKSSAAVSNLLDRPSLARPASPALDMDLVTSSQILREKDIQPSKLNFGFLGLGIMGSGIVKNLLNSGHTVTVWNRTVEKATEFGKIGAKQAITPGDVINESDITFSCVADPKAAKDMVFGNCGVLSEISSSKGYVEMTGIDA